jgi:hypothetical protein
MPLSAAGKGTSESPKIPGQYPLVCRGQPRHRQANPDILGTAAASAWSGRVFHGGFYLLRQHKIKKGNVENN